MKKAKGISADIINGVIYVTKAFAKRASVAGSNEHEIFLHYQKAYPNFATKRKITAIRSDKVTHNGLTLDFMKRYAETHTEAPEILREFQSIIFDYTGHPAFYSKVKSWFLTQFPEHTAKRINEGRTERKRANASVKQSPSYTIETHIKTEVVHLVTGGVTVISSTPPQKEYEILEA